MAIWIETEQMYEPKSPEAYSYRREDAKPLPNKFKITARCARCRATLLQFVAGDGKDGFLGGVVEAHECPAMMTIGSGATS